MEKSFFVQVAIINSFYNILIILARMQWAALDAANTSWVLVITWESAPLN